MSKIAALVSTYRRHITVPWNPGVAGIQRVIFAVYDKVDELRLRANVDEFRLATEAANKKWLPIDVTNAFPEWLAANRHRERYFEKPARLDGYPVGEINPFIDSLTAQIKEQLAGKADTDTVVCLIGVSSLFGVARVSTIVEAIKEEIQGRLLVLFPGEFRAEDHSYRLLDARDGWNYLALPLMAE